MVIFTKTDFPVNKQKHKIDKMVLRQHKVISTRLPYSNEKTREIYYSMVNIYKGQINGRCDFTFVIYNS